LEEKKIENVKYAGRKVGAATATGSLRLHEQEIKNFLNSAFGIKE